VSSPGPKRVKVIVPMGVPPAEGGAGASVAVWERALPTGPGSEAVEVRAAEARATVGASKPVAEKGMPLGWKVKVAATMARVWAPAVMGSESIVGTLSAVASKVMRQDSPTARTTLPAPPGAVNVTTPAASGAEMVQEPLQAAGVPAPAPVALNEKTPGSGTAHTGPETTPQAVVRWTSPTVAVAVSSGGVERFARVSVAGRVWPTTWMEEKSATADPNGVPYAGPGASIRDARTPTASAANDLRPISSSSQAWWRPVVPA
jgi:hypothetical protein